MSTTFFYVNTVCKMLRLSKALHLLKPTLNTLNNVVYVTLSTAEWEQIEKRKICDKLCILLSKEERFRNLSASHVNKFLSSRRP